jgi:GT2 family glycosyltransferase
MYLKHPKNNPLVSIIIVNWNGGKVFDDCLNSLNRINYPNWELIVVDNGSVDGSERNLRERASKAKEVRLIKNSENLGFVPANNQGYEKAKGDYLLLLNNDTRVTPNFLSKMVKRLLKDPSIGVIQPKIFLMDKPGYLDNCGSYLTKIGFLEHWGFFEKDKEEFDREKEIFSAKGACMLIQKGLVDDIGLFDPDFVSYFEESDFCWRVWLVGRRVLYYPKARIFHKLAYTARRLNPFDVNYHSFKNRFRSIIKYPQFINLVLILILHLFVLSILMLFYLIKLEFKQVAMIVKSILWNMYKLPSTLKIRSQIQKARIVGDDVLFRSIMRPLKITTYFGYLRRLESDLKREV